MDTHWKCPGCGALNKMDDRLAIMVESAKQGGSFFAMGNRSFRCGCGATMTEEQICKGGARTCGASD